MPRSSGQAVLAQSTHTPNVRPCRSNPSIPAHGLTEGHSTGLLPALTVQPWGPNQSLLSSSGRGRAGSPRMGHQKGQLRVKGKGTSLLVQWLRFTFQGRGFKSDPWSGLGAKKPKHKMEAIV